MQGRATRSIVTLFIVTTMTQQFLQPKKLLRNGCPGYCLFVVHKVSLKKSVIVLVRTTGQLPVL